MIQVEKFQQSLEQSGLSTEYQQAILGSYPLLTPRVQEYFFVEIERSDAKLAGGHLVEAAAAMGALLKQTTGGDVSQLKDILTTGDDDSLYDFGLLILPFILDLEDLLLLHKVSLDADVQQKMLEFELKMFKDLSPDALSRVLNRNLLFAIDHFDLFMECKRLFYYQSRDFDAAWKKQIMYSLETNVQIIGNIQIIIAGKTVDSSISQWIKDFLTSGADKNTYGVVEYISSSTNAKGLSKTDQRVLGVVLKLYLWLRSPKVSKAEVDEYELKLRTTHIPSSIGGNEYIHKDSVAVSRSSESTISKANGKIPLISSVPKVPRPPQPQQNRQAVNLQEQLIASGSEVKEIMSPKPFTDLPAPKIQETKRNPVATPSSLVASANIPIPKVPNSAAVPQSKPMPPRQPKPPVRPSVGIPLKPDITPRRTGFTPNIQDLLNSDKGKRSGDLSGMTLSGVLPPKLDMDSLQKESVDRASSESETDTEKQNT